MPSPSPRSVCVLLVAVLCVSGLQAAANSDVSHAHPSLSASAPHLYYSCPAGGTAKLLCALKGAIMYPEDMLKQAWLFTPHSDQHCHNKVFPRCPAGSSHSHGNHSLPPGVHYGSEKESFWVELQNLTPSDQGRYCCHVLDVHVENNHGTLVQKSHSHVILHVTPKRNGSQDCTIWDPNPPGASVSAALATAACIMALLSLPLILVLVYKQRQSAHASRRAHELVRMDSEAQSYENPVFLGGSPQMKTRTVSQIMTRQASETGRHLLSGEPGTPLSPPGHGDVFFPSHDPIPESPVSLIAGGGASASP